MKTHNISGLRISVIKSIVDTGSSSDRDTTYFWRRYVMENGDQVQHCATSTTAFIHDLPGLVIFYKVREESDIPTDMVPNPPVKLRFQYKSVEVPNAVKLYQKRVEIVKEVVM